MHFLHVLVWLLRLLMFHSWRAWPTDIKLFHKYAHTDRVGGRFRKFYYCAVTIVVWARSCHIEWNGPPKLHNPLFLISMVWFIGSRYVKDFAHQPPCLFKNHGSIAKKLSADIACRTVCVHVFAANFVFLLCLLFYFYTSLVIMR